MGVRVFAFALRSCACSLTSGRSLTRLCEAALRRYVQLALRGRAYARPRTKRARTLTARRPTECEGSQWELRVCFVRGCAAAPRYVRTARTRSRMSRYVRSHCAVSHRCRARRRVRRWQGAQCEGAQVGTKIERLQRWDSNPRPPDPPSQVRTPNHCANDAAWSLQITVFFSQSLRARPLSRRAPAPSPS